MATIPGENRTEAETIAALQRTVLFGDLSWQELAAIAQVAMKLSFKAGEMLFLSGEEAKGIFLIVSGKIRVFQHSMEGREQVMHVDTAGSVVAEVPVFDGGPYPASSIAEADVEALFINKDDVLRFCAAYPGLALKALRLMAQRVRKHAQLVEVLSFHEVGQRLARFLLTQAEYPGIPPRDGIAFELPFSNHEIATRIGSVRDVVSRSLARLRHDGLIAIKDRRLTILNLEALRLYAATAEVSGERMRLAAMRETAR